MKVIFLLAGVALLSTHGSGTTDLVFAVPAGRKTTWKSLDLSGGAILASRVGAQSRFVTATSLPQDVGQGCAAGADGR